MAFFAAPSFHEGSVAAWRSAAGGAGGAHDATPASANGNQEQQCVHDGHGAVPRYTGRL